MTNLNTYEVKGTNKHNGNEGTWKMKATSEDEIRNDPFNKRGIKIDSIMLIEENVKTQTKQLAPVKKEIVDAEEMLYEMDANGVDEVVVIEGFGSKTIIKREDVERQLGLSGMKLSNNLIKKLKNWREECTMENGGANFKPDTYDAFLESLTRQEKVQIRTAIIEGVCNSDELLGTVQHGLKIRLEI